MRYYLWNLYKNFQGEILQIPGRAIAFFGLIALFLLMLIPTHPYLPRVLTLCAIMAIYAASWDLLLFAGQLNLGHCAFLGMAAYASAILNTKLGLPVGATILIGALVGVVTGLVVCLPALRLRGPYLKIVTLVFPIILAGLVFAFSDVTGGENGIFGLAKITNSPLITSIICFFIMLASVLIMWKLTDTKSSIIRTGIIFSAIREDEIGARIAGINTVKYKLLAFAISGFFAGIAGGLYVHFIGVSGPSTLDFMMAIWPVVWTIFGSARTIWGPIVGVYMLFPLSELLLLTVPQFKMIIFTGLVVIMLLFMPEGIGSWVRDKLEVRCPRCRVLNSVRRNSCRACTASLQTER